MAEKLLRLINRVDTESKWTTVNPALAQGEIVSSIFPDGSIKFKIGTGSTYNKTPFVNDQFVSKEELEDMVAIVQGIASGDFSLIQITNQGIEPDHPEVNFWIEIEED